MNRGINIKVVKGVEPMLTGEKTLWLLLVDVGHYNHSRIIDIPSAQADIDTLEELYKRMRSDERLFTRKCIWRLSATKPGLKDEDRPYREYIRDLFEHMERGVINQVQESDTVLFFFCGHGMTLKGEQWILPMDALPDKPEASCIRLEQLFTWIRAVEEAGARTVLFLDSCRDEVMLPEPGRHAGSVSGEMTKEFFDTLVANAQGRAIFSACRYGQVAFMDQFEDPFRPGVRCKYGVFSRYLVDALLGEADKDQDGLLSLTEISTFTSSKVMEHMIQRRWKRQEPSLTMFDVSGVLAVGVAPFRAPPPSPPTGLDKSQLKPTIQTGQVRSSIDRIVRNALDQIEAEEASRMGTAYIRDVNSRRVFGKLRKELGEDSDTEGIESLVGYLDEHDAMVRWKAMRLLTYYRFSDKETVRDYWNSESDRAIRSIVLEAADNLPEEEAFLLLSDIAQYDDDARIRCSALVKLAALATKDRHQTVISVCLQTLSDQTSSNRCEALKQLRLLNAKEAVEKAQFMVLHDEENSVRVAAAKLLSELGPVDSAGQVFQAYTVNRINNDVLRWRIHTYVRRFGQEALLAESRKIDNPKAKEEVEQLIQSIQEIVGS